MSELTTENYNVWLSTLKVGDRVAITKSRYGNNEIYFTEIVKITQKCGIRVKYNPDHLFKDGEYDSGGRFGVTTTLRPITSELVNEYNRRIRLGKIEDFHGWDKLDNETINTIHALLFKKESLSAEKNEVQK